MRLGAAILALAFALVSTGCPPSDSLSGVWGSSSSDVFAVGAGNTILHYDGREWSPMTGWPTSEE